MLPAVLSAPVGATITAATVAITFTFVATQVIIIIVAAAGVVAADAAVGLYHFLFALYTILVKF